MKIKNVKKYVALLSLIFLYACANKNDDVSMGKNTVENTVVDYIYGDNQLYEKADFSILSGKKIGITIQSIENPYWAGIMTATGELLKKYGAEYTIVSCDDTAIKQISQIENFLASDCDMIMAHPSDPDALESVFLEGKEKGVKMLCWDDIMENSDVNWVIDNKVLGYDIGKMTAEFINKYYTNDNKAEVIVIGYPKTKVLLDREEAIKKGLAENAKDNYKIVATQAGLIAKDAQTAVETTLQAYPNARVVTGVCAGAMIGADEALNIYTEGNIPENMGVFTADVTKQQLEHISDEHYPAKGIVGFEGSDEDTANAAISMFALLLNNELKSKNVIRKFENNVINSENVERIKEGMK